MLNQAIPGSPQLPLGSPKPVEFERSQTFYLKLEPDLVDQKESKV